MSQVLLVEDEDIIRDELALFLRRQGHLVDPAPDAGVATRRLASKRYDVVLADQRLPGASGTELISLAGRTPVVIMTGFSVTPSEVSDILERAAEYLPKPIDYERLLAVLGRVAGSPVAVDSMIGRSPGMRALFSKIAKVAPADATVLIRGESGTGKELVARAIHAGSTRAARHLVVLDCTTIPAGLIESELFGNHRGAYTGATCDRAGLIESADGGTLFFDEVGELPLTAQAQLLRVLQDREIRRVGSTRTVKLNVRVVAATHRDLLAMVQSGAFRSDLYHRLRVVELRVPPLRERLDDLIPLAEHMLKNATERAKRGPLHFSREALAALHAYSWPGNVRELENAVERAVLQSEGRSITLAALDLDATSSDGAKTEWAALSSREQFRRVVPGLQGCHTELEIAELFGVCRQTLWRWRRSYGVPRPGLGSSDDDPDFDGASSAKVSTSLE